MRHEYHLLVMPCYRSVACPQSQLLNQLFYSPCHSPAYHIHSYKPSFFCPSAPQLLVKFDCLGRGISHVMYNCVADMHAPTSADPHSYCGLRLARTGFSFTFILDSLPRSGRSRFTELVPPGRVMPFPNGLAECDATGALCAPAADQHASRHIVETC
jgi:hypothetical protein